ncbi:hypothetical protein CL6EHI_198780 [Entamoeba histolytica]|uniref:Uncharacterized protein n=3 Tax=Entamoeba histolytica TaxID=5759 RepID=C4LWS4_ENTH1|nr:hypothetical protein EHI_198780 [Entamoeba histolytica HM-1:IMSS]EAL49611.1 hypothetical protein EHI_198780 [Entamoeba histolytica HM-1:IMSS]EMD49079.1 Hypothetical protein EHI5A_080780 [Entamoeba histolytica KU27]GAT93166.1 hypothetical protein CL6EHI_198780 [Entamoeba histolytica]|eukprot:XP_654997.1 hypothetical protein EHI_198780 [Entamoeba histolytica HM-1:IMSS]
MSVVTRNVYVDNRNYQSKVRAFCIALLNRHCDVEVKQRRNVKVLTLPFFQIKKLQFNNSEDGVIDLQELVKRRVYGLEEKDIQNNINIQRVMYRKKKNGYRESINIINDILSEIGYFICSTQTPGRYSSVKMDIVKSIIVNGVVYNKNEIERIGEEICKEIEKRIGKEKTVLVKQNDNKLSKLLKEK